MSRLTDEQFWSDSYKNVQFQDLSEHSVAILLQKYLPEENDKTAIELGSFPGAFLPTIGRKGYTLNGIDFNPRNVDALPTWLKSKGLQVKEFNSGDIFEFVSISKERFDLVCSFGLIEHFENYEEVIRLHLSLLKPGGKLVITTPNFRGWMQYLPHRLFDAYNLSKHYLPSMNPSKWKTIIEKEGLQVLFSGYFGGYSFWVDREQKRSRINKALLRFTELSIYQLRKILCFQSSAFSAFCGIVAIKDNEKG